MVRRATEKSETDAALVQWLPLRNGRCTMIIYLGIVDIHTTMLWGILIGLCCLALMVTPLDKVS